MNSADHEDSPAAPQFDPARVLREPRDPFVPSRPLFVPRGLVMLSALWVFLTWILLFGFRPPVQPQSASYGPTLEILFASIGVGIAVAWPLLRLSGRPSSAPIAQGAFDGFAILVLLQVVIWPLRLVSSWTLPRTWLVVASIAVAVSLVGAVLALTQASPSRRVRTRAMIALVAAAVLPIAVNIVGELVAPTGSPIFAAPVAASDGASWRTLSETAAPMSGPALLWRCASAIPLDPGPSEWEGIRRGALIAAGLWFAAIVVRIRQRFRGHRPKPADPLS